MLFPCWTRELRKRCSAARYLTGRMKRKPPSCQEHVLTEFLRKYFPDMRTPRTTRPIFVIPRPKAAGWGALPHAVAGPRFSPASTAAANAPQPIAALGRGGNLFRVEFAGPSNPARSESREKDSTRGP